MAHERPGTRRPRAAVGGIATALRTARAGRAALNGPRR